MRAEKWEIVALAGVLAFFLFDVFVWNIPIATWLGPDGWYVYCGILASPFVLFLLMVVVAPLPCDRVKRALYYSLCSVPVFLAWFILHRATQDVLHNHTLVKWLFGAE